MYGLGMSLVDFVDLGFRGDKLECAISGLEEDEWMVMIWG